MMDTSRTRSAPLVLLCGSVLFGVTMASGEPPARSDACPATDVGMLASDGSVTISGDTCGSLNDFENDGYDCNYGSGSNDEIFQFTVDQSGYWQLDTMCVGWDTSLMVREETGGGCPGEFHDCDGDSGHGACGAYESALITFLTTETTYYLVVDGWSPFTCGTFDVVTFLAIPACTSDADCDDGRFCNGAEFCDLATGECVAGSHPCAWYQTCDEQAGVCISPDPCISWLGGRRASPPFAGWPPLVDCPNVWILDDIELRNGASHELISYRVNIVARAIVNPVGTMYFVDLALWTVEGDSGMCMPGEIIPGSECYGFADDIDPGGSPSDIFFCPALGVVLPDNSGDFSRCEIDFFLGRRSNELGARDDYAGQPQLIGGPAGDDDFGVSIFFLEDCPAGTGTFTLSWWLGYDSADFANAQVCTEPFGVCCRTDSGIPCQEDIFEDDCAALGGEWSVDAFYAPVGCADPDGDGLPTLCGDNCPDVYNPDQEDCDLGTTPEGDACELDPDYADDDDDGTCNGTDECPDDPTKIDPGICGCGVPDIDSDGDGTADCNDECPSDANKDRDDDCGCGGGPMCGFNNPCDSDGDGVHDCVESCPGVDDRIFAPACVNAIPTVSTWGLIIMALLLLLGAKLQFPHRLREDP